MKSKIYQDTIRDLMKLSVPKGEPQATEMPKGAHGVSITIHTAGAGKADPGADPTEGAEDEDPASALEPLDLKHTKEMKAIHAKQK